MLLLLVLIWEFSSNIFGFRRITYFMSLYSPLELCIMLWGFLKSLGALYSILMCPRPNTAHTTILLSANTAHLCMHRKAYIYRECVYIQQTYFFPGKEGDFCCFISLPVTLKNMLPKRSGCFNQVFLDSSRRRTYTVILKRIVGRTVKRENKGQELCVVKGW